MDDQHVCVLCVCHSRNKIPFSFHQHALYTTTAVLLLVPGIMQVARMAR